MTKGACVSIILIASMLVETGCSLIGASVDRSMERTSQTRVDWEKGEAKSGQEVVISMKDGWRYEGRYVGLQKEPYESYSFHFGRWKKLLDAPDMIPNLEDTLEVYLSENDRITGMFKGFEKGEEGPVLELNLFSKEQEAIPISAIKTLNTPAGLSVNLEYLASALTHERTPFRTKLTIKKDGFPLYLNADQVGSVVIVKKNKRSTGFIAGLVIDVLVVALAVLLVSDCKHILCQF